MVCVEVPGIQHLIYPGFRSVRKLPPAGRSEMTYMRCDLNRSMQHLYSNTTEEDVEYEIQAESIKGFATSASLRGNIIAQRKNCPTTAPCYLWSKF